MRIIDADAIPYTILYKENWMKGTGEEAQGAWKSDIDNMPTIDAVQVVRCKDCVYYREDLCDRLKYSHVTNAYSFCSEGERKEE